MDIFAKLSRQTRCVSGRPTITCGAGRLFLTVGDHILRPLHALDALFGPEVRWATHHGIYLGTSESMVEEFEKKRIGANASVYDVVRALPGEQWVVHFYPEASGKEAKVILSTIHVFMDGDVALWRRKYSSALSPAETVKSAFGELGKGGYNAKSNNCEHFATYCKTGKRTSKQPGAINWNSGGMDSATDEPCAFGDEPAALFGEKAQQRRPVAAPFADADGAQRATGIFDVDIEKVTLDSDAYRRVLWTAGHLQVVTMSLRPGEKIDMERHDDRDQFFRVERGAIAINTTGGGSSHRCGEGQAALVTGGTDHEVVADPRTGAKLYTIYAPPEHPAGLVQQEKEKEPNDEHARCSLPAGQHEHR